MIKKLAAVIVLVLVVCTFAGCTTTNNTNQTSSATSNATSSAATTHDAFFEKYLAVYKNVTYANSSRSVTAWELTWMNNTSVHVGYTAFNKTTNSTSNRVQTIMMFPTSQDATNYVNAMNKTTYSLASIQYGDSLGGLAYQNVTGHAPQVFKSYRWNVGYSEAKEFLDIDNHYRWIAGYSEAKEILQIDNIVVVATIKTSSSG